MTNSHDDEFCVHCGEETDELYIVPGERGEPQRCRDCEIDRTGLDPRTGRPAEEADRA